MTIREALEWYANEMHYHPNGAPMTPFINGHPDPNNPPKDFGAIAREALASPPAEDPLLAEMAEALEEAAHWMEPKNTDSPCACSEDGMCLAHEYATEWRELVAEYEAGKAGAK